MDRQYEAVLGFKSLLKDYRPAVNGRYCNPFTILEWGNELFADYQPHNSSVFSLFDSLDGIQNATVTYYVVGFHQTQMDDPFWVDEPATELRPTWQEIMKTEKMQLNIAAFQGGGGSRDQFLSNRVDTTVRAVCHGTVRSVHFDRSKLDSNVKTPAILLQELTTSSHPIAVGTDIMDALLAYLRVRFHAKEKEKVYETIDDTLSKLLQLIMRKDDIESQQKARDEVATSDWVPEKNELLWTFANSQATQEDNHGAPAPSADDLHLLRKLNYRQNVIASCHRETMYLRHVLFAYWWKAVEVEESDQKKSIRNKFKEEIATIKQRLDVLHRLMDESQAQLEELSKTAPTLMHLQTVSAPAFGTHRDPTILFAGVESGWPSGFQDPVMTRHSAQLPEPDLRGFSDRFSSDLQAQLFDKFPIISDVVKRILPEVIASNPAGTDFPQSIYAAAGNNQEHFDNTQGWFPLFMEWEVEYYHISWKHWKFVQDGDGTRRYTLRDDIPIKDIPGASESRKIHGRTLFVPQASQTLKTRLDQLFQKIIPEDRDKLISKDDQEKVLKQVAGLEFFSAPLNGIREHMLTLVRDGHVGLMPKDPLASQDLGMDEQLIINVSETSQLAPYGRTHRLPAEYAACPFKPVTHGQFRFTRLDIVDKFGQVVNAVEPADLSKPATTLYPCLSSKFFCDPVPQKESFAEKLPFPNTAVLPGDLRGVCQFFQMSPRINQPARLNSAFVVREDGKHRQASPWDNPIWGWILVNHADHSLQLFNAAGKFAQEIFIHPDEAKAQVTSRPQTSAWSPPGDRLGAFISLCTDYYYALGFYNMAARGLRASGSNPSERSDFLPAAFGDVLCLADFGVSIELSCPPYTNQSSKPAETAAAVLTDYEFDIAFGNASAGYDGTVGYYDLSVGIKDIYSSFGYPRDAASATIANRSPVLRPVPLKLSPYFLPGDASEYGEAQNDKLTVFGGIMDPFRSIHIYTGDLFPMKELTLPKWALDQATKEMHAFFKAGPILVPSVPELNRMSTTSTSAGRIDLAMQMPLLGLDEWEWLHPKLDMDKDGKPVSTEPTWQTVPVRPTNVALNQGGTIADVSEIVEGYFVMKKSLQEARAT